MVLWKAGASDAPALRETVRRLLLLAQRVAVLVGAVEAAVGRLVLHVDPPGEVVLVHGRQADQHLNLVPLAGHREVVDVAVVLHGAGRGAPEGLDVGLVSDEDPVVRAGHGRELGAGQLRREERGVEVDALAAVGVLDPVGVAVDVVEIVQLADQAGAPLLRGQAIQIAQQVRHLLVGVLLHRGHGGRGGRGAGDPGDGGLRDGRRARGRERGRGRPRRRDLPGGQVRNRGAHGRAVVDAPHGEHQRGNTAHDTS